MELAAAATCCELNFYLYSSCFAKLLVGYGTLKQIYFSRLT